MDNNVGKVANATKDGSSVQNDFDYIYPWSDITKQEKFPYYVEFPKKPERSKNE